MTIKVGTLCLLVGSHLHAGKTCTVTGALAPRLGFDPRGRYGTVLAYRIEIPGVAPRKPCVAFGAYPRDLVPIAPPGFREGTPTTIRQPEELVR